MFKQSEYFNFGSKIKAHGKEWYKILPVGIDCYLAIRADTEDYPAEIFLIKPDKNQKSS